MVTKTADKDGTKDSVWIEFSYLICGFIENGANTYLDDILSPLETDGEDIAAG
jgi:hypothetical protein